MARLLAKEKNMSIKQLIITTGIVSVYFAIVRLFCL